jgi:L-fuconolactonase
MDWGHQNNMSKRIRDNMIIDAHQHFWQFDPVRDKWIDDTMRILQRDFLPQDLKNIYENLGIDGCIPVQADQSENETIFLLELANKYSFIKTVVGWVDLRSDNIEERLDFFSAYKKLAGFRHILQAEDMGRMLESSFLRGIEALGKYNFTYDILIYPRHLEAAIELVKRFPDQKFVIDHMAKPAINKGTLEPWTMKMNELAGFENVYCKVSGLVTEADWKNWKPEDLKPYLDHVFDVFGTGRLLFGSDWPVCLLAGNYEQIYTIITAYLREFSDDERHDVMGHNAMDFYGIDS